VYISQYVNIRSAAVNVTVFRRLCGASTGQAELERFDRSAARDLVHVRLLQELGIESI